ARTGGRSMFARRWLAALLMAVFLGLPNWAFLVAAPAGDERPSADPAAPADPAAGAPAAAKDEPLSALQDVINRRYKRFEDTLRKIAESLRKTDPDRADLLFRAIGKSNADRISQQMIDLIALLKDNKQLGDAIE